MADKDRETIDVGRLDSTIGALVRQLREHAMQGATAQEFLDSQAIDVCEEAGELAGAYRRWRGFARRDGSTGQVISEAADVIIATGVFLHLFCPDPDIITKALSHKLATVFSRGWVNKPTDDEYILQKPDASGDSGILPASESESHWGPVPPEEDDDHFFNRHLRGEA